MRKNPVVFLTVIALAVIAVVAGVAIAMMN